MTTKELRELDAWIAEHVMGWVKTPDAERTEAFRVGGRLMIWKLPQWAEEVPCFTTDPAAAMQVLEKCIAKEGCAVIYKVGGGYIMCSDDIADTHGETTLPLVICLFAKRLFSK